MWRENWNKVYVKKTMIISIVIQQLSSINYYMSSPSLYICIQIYIQWQERNVCIIVNIIFDQICFFIFYFWYTWEYKYQSDHQVFLFSTANETEGEAQNYASFLGRLWALVGPQILFLRKSLRLIYPV